MGLGSFTGIRIGIATTKGLATSKNIPVMPISSTELGTHNYAKNIGIAAYKKYMQGDRYTVDMLGAEYGRPSNAEILRFEKQN